jgi:hypothetical protein
MAEDTHDQRSSIDHATQQETLCDWLGASESYGRVLGLVPEDDHVLVGDVLERKAFALYRAAFQSDSNLQFTDRISASIECYREAVESYGKTLAEKCIGRKLRCDGMTEYLGFWHAVESEERKKLVNKSWETTTKALDSFRSAGDVVEFCRTYNQLSWTAFRVIEFLDDFAARTAVIKNAITYGQHALDHIAELPNVRASWFLDLYSLDFCGGKESLRNDLASRELLDKAMAVSEEVTCKELVSFYYLPSPVDSHEQVRLAEMALEYGKKANDKFVIGSASDWIAQRTYWALAQAVDMDDVESCAARGYDLYQQAKKMYAIVGYIPATIEWAWALYPDPWHYCALSLIHTDPKKKREYAKKALALEPKMRELAAASGYPDVILDVDMRVADALTALAKTELDLEKKRRFLEDALRIAAVKGEEYARIHPFHHGALSVNAGTVADIEYELAIMETDSKLRAERLRNALEWKKKVVDLGGKLVEEVQDLSPRSYVSVFFGIFRSAHGACALKLYETTADRKDLETAIRSFEESVEWFLNADQPSRCAESYWTIARAYDLLGNYQKSYQRFSDAAKQYEAASKKFPRLAPLYHDHSRYMEAWGEIQRAKHHHLKQEYIEAGEHYQRAADLLASTGQWKFLASNYLAWSFVEKAEGLSNIEDVKAAISAFGEAQRSFEGSRAELRARLSASSDGEEALMVGSMLKAADIRKTYCGARALIEEAGLLDKEGKESASSEKYGLAVEMLEKTDSIPQNDWDKREIELSIALAKSWQMLTSAEAEVSPELFSRASQLFERVKDLSQNEKAKSLALGHSRFCKALEAGMKFSDTAEASFHAEATKYLESAAKYYLKADNRTASEYANASRLLFDSYVYMDRATKEEDHDAKARLYVSAEKVLEASAASFEQAAYPGKKEQVLKLLSKVKRDRQLALSLSETLRAPDISSKAVGFVSPVPTHETATGLERFEHADIQAIVVAHPKDIHVGEDIKLEIELVNAGKGVAQLSRVEEIIPRGFDVIEAPERCRIEDSHVNLRGRRLDALNTEDVKLVLKARERGRFALNPRITYLDDAGRQRSFQPASIEINVKELGISGWLRGPDRKV